MAETTTSIFYVSLVALVWLAWVLFSETRRNHGFWVAFLLPLAPVIFPILWITYVLIKYLSLLAFIVLGQKKEHEDFMRTLRIRSGVFLLFE